MRSAGSKLLADAEGDGWLSELFEWPEGLCRRLLEGDWESSTAGKIRVEGSDLLVACAGVSRFCTTKSSSSLSERSWRPPG